MEIFGWYKKRTDGREWTKNTFLRELYKAVNIPTVTCERSCNTWLIREDCYLSIDFAKAQYSPKRVLELDDVLVIGPEDQEFAWDWPSDALGRGGRGRLLSIRKNERFEGSLAKRYAETDFRALILNLQDDKIFYRLVRGEEVNINNKNVRLRDLRKFNFATKDLVMRIGDDLNNRS